MSGDGAVTFTLARLGPPALASGGPVRLLARDLLPDRQALTEDASQAQDAGGFAGRVLGNVSSGGGLGGGNSDALLKLQRAVYLGQVGAEISDCIIAAACSCSFDQAGGTHAHSSACHPVLHPCSTLHRISGLCGADHGLQLLRRPHYNGRHQGAQAAQQAICKSV